MNIIFFGSSEFSIPVLQTLVSRHSVVHVVTTPDRKRGRGQKLSGTVVKEFALRHHLNVSEPEKLSDSGFISQLKQLNSDFIVIASYGKLVPASIFTLSKIASLNVHPSLLPRHRGASPIQRTILEGDQKTGVSIAEITKDLDAGDLYAQVETSVDLNENSSELSKRLSEMAAGLLLQLIENLKTGRFRKMPQDSSKATYAKKIGKGEGKIDWNKSNVNIHNQVRAYYPWPGAFAFFKDKRLKIIKTELSRIKDCNADPASIVSIEQDGIMVKTLSDCILLKKVQLEGRNEMEAHEFALGQRIQKGDHFD